MKLKLLKPIALAMVAAMALSACSTPAGKTEETKTDAAATDTTKTDETKEAPAEGDKAEGSKEEAAAPDDKDLITITAVSLVDSATQNKVLNQLGETMEKNRWNDLIAKQLGYKIVYKWVVNDQEQYNQKFNASIAAGDMPDIARLNNVQLKQCVDAGLLAEMGSKYEEFASPLLKEIVEGGGPNPVAACTFDGTQYALAKVDADIERGALLFLRTDWLKQTGLEAPKTIDELITIMKAFNEIAGPGAVGMTLQKEPINICDNYRINGLMYGYGAYPNMWVKDGDQLVYGNTTPQFKEGLAKLAEIYSMGLMDKEFIVKDSVKVNETVISGKSGVVYGAHWTPINPLQDNMNDDPNASWEAFNLPSKDGSPTKVGIEMATNEWFAASTKCTNPEVVIQLANLYCEKTFDPEKQEYEYYSNPGGDAEGVWKLSPVYMMTPLKNIDTMKAIRPHLESGDPGDLYGEQLAMFNYSYKAMQGDRQLWCWDRIFGIDSTCQINWEQQLEPGNVHMNEFFGAPTATMSTNKTVLDKAFDEAIVKVISGQMPVEDFDKAVQSWYDGGGTAITKEVNEWYQTVKK